MTKKFYTSKTFWVNILAIVALVIQTQTGFVISAELEVSILAVINVILRAITNTSIEW